MLIFVNFDHASDEVKSGVLAAVDDFKNEMLATVRQDPGLARQLANPLSIPQFRGEYTVGATVDYPHGVDFPVRLRVSREPGLGVQMRVYVGASRDTVLDDEHMIVIPRKDTVREEAECASIAARRSGFSMTEEQAAVFVNFTVHQLRALYTADLPESGRVFSIDVRRSEVFGYDGETVRSRCHAMSWTRVAWLATLGCDPEGSFAARMSVGHGNRVFTCAFVLPIVPPPGFFPNTLAQVQTEMFVGTHGNLNERFLRRECFACGAGGCVKICSKCRKASYCSRECQKQDWRNHKTVCNFLSA